MKRLALLAAFGMAGLAAAAPDLLVCSLLTDEVLRYDGATGAYEGVFAGGALVNGPQGITIGPDGNVYVASEYSANITKWSPSGAYLGEFVPPMAGWEDLEFGPDGHLYAIAHGGMPEGPISKFDGSTGTYLGQWGFGGGMHHQHGMTFGPDGALYYGRVDMGAVTRIDPVTGVVTGNLVEDGLIAGLFDMVFHGGVLYTDEHFGSGGVHKFDAATGAYLGEFIVPAGPTWGMIFHDDGLFYVATGGAVLRYDAVTGAFHDAFATGIGGAAGIAFVPEAVPEPATITVLALGVAALCRRRRR